MRKHTPTAPPPPDIPLADPLPRPDGGVAWLYALLPLAAFAAAAPWIVRFIYVEMPVELAPAYGAWRRVDAYCEYKSSALLALAAVMAAALAVHAFGAGAARCKAGFRARGVDAWALWAFLALTVVAAACSAFQVTVWWGAPLRREGALTILAYGAAAGYGRVFLRDPRALRWFYRLLLASAFGLAVWGVAQSKGLNPLAAPGLAPVLASTPSVNTGRGYAVDHFGNDVRRVLAEGTRPPTYSADQTVAALFNPNYFGTCMAVMVAVALAWGVSATLAARDRRARIRRAVLTALAVAAPAVALGRSKSQGGTFGLALAALATGLVIWPATRYAWARHRRACVVAMAGVLAAVVCGVCFTRTGARLRALAEKARIAWRGHPVPGRLPSFPEADWALSAPTLTRFTLEDGFARLDTPRGPFRIHARALDPIDLEVRDGNGLRPALRWSSPDARGTRAAIWDSPEYGVVRFWRNDAGGRVDLEFPHDDGLFRAAFAVEPTASHGPALVYYPNPLLRVERFAPPPAWRPWAGFDRFASGRGYFWARIAPMLPRAGWRGFGPDTIAHVFPHADLAARPSSVGEDYIIHKIHNWYLATWMGQGWPALLALLVFLVFHFRRLAKAWRAWFARTPFTADDAAAVRARAALASFAGGVAFAGAVCWTDSTVHVAPVFWGLVGAGWAACSGPKITIEH